MFKRLEPLRVFLLLFLGVDGGYGTVGNIMWLSWEPVLNPIFDLTDRTVNLPASQTEITIKKKFLSYWLLYIFQINNAP